MSFGYYESLDETAKTRYRLKLNAAGVDECPYKLPEGLFKNDPTSWPDVCWGDVYVYLVESPGM